LVVDALFLFGTNFFFLDAWTLLAPSPHGVCNATWFNMLSLGSFIEYMDVALPKNKSAGSTPANLLIGPRDWVKNRRVFQIAKSTNFYLVYSSK